MPPFVVGEQEYKGMVVGCSAGVLQQQVTACLRAEWPCGSGYGHYRAEAQDPGESPAQHSALISEFIFKRSRGVHFDHCTFDGPLLLASSLFGGGVIVPRH
jgi:hypothetical protein